MPRPNEKKIHPPKPILDEAMKLCVETGFDFNTLNSIAWLKLLYTRGKKPTVQSLEKYITYLKSLK